MNIQKMREILAKGCIIARKKGPPPMGVEPLSKDLRSPSHINKEDFENYMGSYVGDLIDNVNAIKRDSLIRTMKVLQETVKQLRDQAAMVRKNITEINTDNEEDLLSIEESLTILESLEEMIAEIEPQIASMKAMMEAVAQKAEKGKKAKTAKQDEWDAEKLLDEYIEKQRNNNPWLTDKDWTLVTEEKRSLVSEIPDYYNLLSEIPDYYNNLLKKYKKHYK